MLYSCLKQGFSPPGNNLNPAGPTAPEALPPLKETSVLVCGYACLSDRSANSSSHFSLFWWLRVMREAFTHGYTRCISKISHTLISHCKSPPSSAFSAFCEVCWLYALREARVFVTVFTEMTVATIHANEDVSGSICKRDQFSILNSQSSIYPRSLFTGIILNCQSSILNLIRSLFTLHCSPASFSILNHQFSI